MKEEFWEDSISTESQKNLAFHIMSATPDTYPHLQTVLDPVRSFSFTFIILIMKPNLIISLFLCSCYLPKQNYRMRINGYSNWKPLNLSKLISSSVFMVRDEFISMCLWRKLWEEKIARHETDHYIQNSIGLRCSSEKPISVSLCSECYLFRYPWNGMP